MNKKTTLGVGFILGALVGVAVGVLFAPQKGEKTRKELLDKSKKIIKNVKFNNEDEMINYSIQKIDDIYLKLKKYKRDKDLKYAKKKIKELKYSVKELIELTKDISDETLVNSIYKLKDDIKKEYNKIKEKISEDYE